MCMGTVGFCGYVPQLEILATHGYPWLGTPKNYHVQVVRNHRQLTAAAIQTPPLGIGFFVGPTEVTT